MNNLCVQHFKFNNFNKLIVILILIGMIKILLIKMITIIIFIIKLTHSFLQGSFSPQIVLIKCLIDILFSKVLF